MVKDYDVVVVGGGLFGGCAAHALKRAGRRVAVVDDGRALSGSKPSACLMKPSWMMRLSTEVKDAGFQLLDSLFGLQELEFDVVLPRPGSRRQIVQHKVLRVEPRSVMDFAKFDTYKGTATSVARGGVLLSTQVELSCNLVVVAAGVWTDKLLKSGRLSRLRGAQGVSFLASPPGDELADRHNTIRPWLPFKQVVAFRIPNHDHWWIGDGTSVKCSSWSEEREEACQQRCAEELGLTYPELSRHVGIRPVIKGADPCLLEEVEEDVWALTGGGKNGTIAAGWAASKLVELTS